MTTVIAFILMFGLLVFIHEFGHLIFAKRAGMLAREFAIGFGPKVYSFTKNETVYTLRLLPIGGYVRVAGEDPEIIEIKPGHHIGLEFNDYNKVSKIIVNHKDKHPLARVIEVEKVDLDHELIIEGYEIEEYENKLQFQVDPKADFIMDETETQIAPYDRQFASKSKRQRAMQLFAGPLMNFLLAIVIFFILGIIQGVPTEKAMVDNIQPDSPATEAGLQDKDEITSMNNQKVSTWKEFVSVIEKKPNKSVDLKVIREDKRIDLTIVPEKVEEQGKVVGKIGVMQGFEKSFFGTIKYGFEETYNVTKLILTNLFMLITGQYSIDMLSGPVGIYDATDQVVRTGFNNFLMWTAMLSINLGIINLVPLPALDGGRLLFVGIEAIRGKPLDSQKEGIFHFVGFALLMFLMIVVTWNDIQRLFL